MKHRWLAFFIYSSSFFILVSSFAAEQLPNIVFLICDDLGYGDVHCLNPEHGKIATPGGGQAGFAGDDFYRRAFGVVGVQPDALWRDDGALQLADEVAVGGRGRLRAEFDREGSADGGQFLEERGLSHGGDREVAS
jgi:hypothetical protein